MKNVKTIKQFMRETIDEYDGLDELDLAIEAQSHFGLVCNEPDCSVPPVLIDAAVEVLAESGTVVSRLIRGFEDKAGLPGIVYDATYDLIRQVYGNVAAKEFSNLVDVVITKEPPRFRLKGTGCYAIKAIQEKA